MMTFLWPMLLWLLVAIPLLVVLYVWLLRRKKKVAVRYASLAMVKDAMGTGQRIRRHVPPVLFLIALTLMILAISRPAAVVTLPSQRDTVVLAMDVSRSMLAEDVKPNRMVAAQEAARAFVNAQPRTTYIAIVAFAGTVQVVQPPTQNKEDLLAAINRFELQRSTAIGSGLVMSLATLFPDAGITLDSVASGGPGGNRRNGNQSLDRKRDVDRAERPPFVPVPPGSYANGAVILLTDGQTTTGIDPLEAAKLAADRGVKVYTVGVGTKDGEILRTEGWAMRVRLDEDTLKTIASMTHGEYYYAGTATDLTQIYKTLNSRFVLEKKETEITAFFSAAAAVFAVLSAGLSMLWFNRVF
ncbi:MAG: von Willebrand factor, type [Rhizobacter sp.]|nr:von Willebrand factor, type [Rhizobacter sp.]